MEIKQKILEIYNKSNKCKGYRWITSDLHKANFHINHKTATEAHKHLSFALKPHTELKFTDMLKSLPYYRH